MSPFSSPENFCVLSNQLNRAFHGLKTAFQIALDIWILYKHLSADSVAQQINKWLSSEWPYGITGLYRKRWEAVAGSSTLQAAAVRCSQGHSTLEGAAFICLHHLRADRQLCPSSPAASTAGLGLTMLGSSCRPCAAHRGLAGSWRLVPTTCMGLEWEPTGGSLSKDVRRRGTARGDQAQSHTGSPSRPSSACPHCSSLLPFPCTSPMGLYISTNPCTPHGLVSRASPLINTVIRCKVQSCLPGSGTCSPLIAHQSVWLVRFDSCHCLHVCFDRSVSLYVFVCFFLCSLFLNIPSPSSDNLAGISILTFPHALISYCLSHRLLVRFVSLYVLVHGFLLFSLTRFALKRP